MIINMKESSKDTLIKHIQELIQVNMIINMKEYILNSGQVILQDNMKVPLMDNIQGISQA